MTKHTSKLFTSILLSLLYYCGNCFWCLHKSFLFWIFFGIFNHMYVEWKLLIIYFWDFSRNSYYVDHHIHKFHQLQSTQTRLKISPTNSMSQASNHTNKNHESNNTHIDRTSTKRKTHTTIQLNTTKSNNIKLNYNPYDKAQIRQKTQPKETTR